MADSASLEQLMSRYVAGDPEAFDLLYERTCKRVFAFHMVMTGNRDRANDLSQVTYLNLHRARAGYIQGAPLAPWLMAIARNAFLDDARRRKRARVRVTATGDVPETTDPHMPAAPGLRDAIDEAVEALSPGQREAFMLTKHSGLSSRDAARILGTSETAVKLRVHRAYVALRAALAPHYEGES